MASTCLFCKIIKGAISSRKIIETDLSYAFLDISPLNRKHALVIPKAHAAFLHEVPDENLADIGPVIKKVAKAIGAKDYNVLQNNGRLANQAVDHVHFHIIPKDEEGGLTMTWTPQTVSQEDLAADQKSICDALTHV